MGCTQACNKKQKQKRGFKQSLSNGFHQIEIPSADNLFQEMFGQIQKAQECYFDTVNAENRFDTSTQVNLLFKDPDQITGFKVLLYCIFAQSGGDLSQSQIQIQSTYPFIQCQSGKLPNEFNLREMIISFNNLAEQLLKQLPTLKDVLKSLKAEEEKLKTLPEEVMKSLQPQNLDNIQLMQKLKTTCYNCAQVKTAISEIENLIIDYGITLQEYGEVAKRVMQSGPNGYLNQLIDIGKTAQQRIITNQTELINSFWDKKEELKIKAKQHVLFQIYFSRRDSQSIL